MPKKPVKFGIKLWVICEADNGYCLKFQIYTGKLDAGQEKGLSYRVVFDLMEDYLESNHHLFVDNYYTTIKLFQDLEAIHVEQLDRTEKNFLSSLGTLNYNVVNLCFCAAKTSLLFIRKTRDVFVLSTINGTGVQMVQRRHGGPKSKPDMILDYNNHMNGVDKCDQYLASYPFCRKTVKWWKKVFVHLFELCVINSMVIYFKSHPEAEKAYFW